MTIEKEFKRPEPAAPAPAEGGSSANNGGTDTTLADASWMLHNTQQQTHTPFRDCLSEDLEKARGEWDAQAKQLANNIGLALKAASEMMNHYAITQRNLAVVEYILETRRKGAPPS